MDSQPGCIVPTVRCANGDTFPAAKRPLALWHCFSTPRRRRPVPHDLLSLLLVSEHLTNPGRHTTWKHKSCQRWAPPGAPDTGEMEIYKNKSQFSANPVPSAHRCPLQLQQSFPCWTLRPHLLRAGPHSYLPTKKQDAFPWCTILEESVLTKERNKSSSYRTHTQKCSYHIITNNIHNYNNSIDWLRRTLCQTRC